MQELLPVELVPEKYCKKQYKKQGWIAAEQQQEVDFYNRGQNEMSPFIQAVKTLFAITEH